MRVILTLSVLLCGCDLLPKNYLPCNEYAICDPSTASHFVIGQPDDRTNNYTAGFSNPVGVAISKDGQLFVVDSGQSRVMVWNKIPTRNYQRSDFAMGLDNHSLGVGNLPSVTDVSVNDNKLIAGLASAPASFKIWNPIPRQNRDPDGGWAAPSVTGPQGFRSAGSLWMGGHFYLTDSGNHRVLIWDDLPTTAKDASAVLGQIGLIDNLPNAGGAVSERSLNGPLGAPASDGTQFLVADSGNHRVLVWGAPPVSAADVPQWVLGQSSFSVNAANRGLMMPDANTLRAPNAVAIGGGRIAVSDSGNNRVLLWNALITQNGAPADVALGQVGKVTMMPNSGGISASRMSAPRGVATDGAHVVVADSGNQRVLIWNSWPTQSGAPADVILGQRRESESNSLGSQVTSATFGGPTSSNFSGMANVGPSAVAGNASSFFIADISAHRVLVYAAPPTRITDLPIAVLGQPDFESRNRNQSPTFGAGPKAGTLASPSSVAVEGETVAVADSENHRVLIWRKLPRQNQQPPDVILGQTSPMQGMPGGGMSQPDIGFNYPTGVWLAGGKLYVADSGYNRVLIWNMIPGQNGFSPSAVLGQRDLVTTFVNGCPPGCSGTQANGLNRPLAVAAGSQAIFVCDYNNSRVLVWNTISPTNGQTADLVLGRLQLSEFTPMSSMVDIDQRISRPVALALFHNLLAVLDGDYHRILYYDTTRLKTGVAPLGVRGQPDSFTVTPNTGGLAGERFFRPTGLAALDNALYVSEIGNNRVIALPPLAAP